MSIRKVRFPIWVILLFGSSLAFGQAARSPFSSYGLGEQYGNALATDQGMGGVGISNPHYWYLNNQNPAMLIFNRLTTFQAGVIGEQRTQNTTTALSEKSGSGNLNYLVLSIPVMAGKWTSSLSLMPYTKLNYQLKYTQPVAGDTSLVNVTEQGSGGINQFSWSNGVKINEVISVGLRATYLFSAVSTQFSNELQYTKQLLVISPNVYERTFVSDFKFAPAVSIHIDSIGKKNYRVNFGLVYDLQANIAGKFYQRIERHNAAGIIDSVTLIRNQPGTITLPSVLSAGISFAKSYKWIFAVDGSYSNYANYRDMAGSNPYTKESWRVAAGFEATPDGSSLSSYFKRATYRTGVSLENYPYLANGNVVKDFGITFGLSLPVSRLSSLDMAIKFGKKGDKTLNAIEENYIKLYFGLTFNDQWFIKRRFD